MEEGVNIEEARARYSSPMAESQLHESWLALRREMSRQKWADSRGLKAEDVGMAVHPRTGKAFFQWKYALQYLPEARGD